MNGDLVSRMQLPLPNAYVAPRTPTETSLTEIWRGVLSMDRVGIHDSFFDLGGDSLHAAMIFKRIGQTLDQALPVSCLIAAPTVCELALIIDGAKQDEASRRQNTP